MPRKYSHYSFRPNCCRKTRKPMSSKLWFACFSASFLLCSAGFECGNAQTVDTAQEARVLVSQPVDETHRVTLRGNTRPEARRGHDRGAVSDNFPMEHM